MTHDHDRPGRGLRFSALHGWVKQKGAVFGAAGSWERPLHYGGEDTKFSWKHGEASYSDSVETEHNACRKGQQQLPPVPTPSTFGMFFLLYFLVRAR